MRRSTNNKVLRILFAPFKIISKARYFYMKTMWDCAGRVGNGNCVVGPTSQVVTALPKSFSGKSDHQKTNDNEEVVKAILESLAKKKLLTHDKESTINMKEEVAVADDDQLVLKQKTLRSSSTTRVGRSYSVGVGKIGRIDEDRPCSFREEDDDLKSDSYTRSKSHAVSRMCTTVYH